MIRNLPSLVIDDDPQVRGLVADVLRSDGWQVREAADAEQSFRILAETGEPWAAWRGG